jgi:hypothetical protein
MPRPMAVSAWALVLNPVRQTSSDFSVLNAVSTMALSKQLPFPLDDAARKEVELALIRERTMAGLAAARARSRKGGRKFARSRKRPPSPLPPLRHIIPSCQGGYFLSLA